MISSSHIMTEGLIVIDTSAKSESAKGKMKKESIGYLPVVETQADGKTVIKGMVTFNHIIQTLFPAGTVERGDHAI